LGALLVLALVGAACGDPEEESAAAQDAGATDTEDATPRASRTPSPTPTVVELPRGGRTLFPDYRVVAYYGNAASESLGVLGEGPPDEVAKRLIGAGAPFETPDRPVQLAFELIATVAQAKPGDDGDYAAEAEPAQVQEYLDAARRIQALLILDIQPGRGDFLAAVQRYEEFLLEPDVGLALDPEWSMAAGEVPGESIGQTSAAVVNQIGEYLSELVARENLPEKLFVLHLFDESMIPDRDQIVPHEGLATTFHVDGFGGRDAKTSRYEALHADPAQFANGFKLFYDEDVNIFAPPEVLALVPPPDLITYQ